MCGILGYYGHDVVRFSDLTSLQKLDHRGPDNSGEILGEGYYLGQTRLSIIDLSEKGNQPMVSKDERYVLIFNGEIYNHLELREEALSEFNFESHSDTETLLYGLIKYGKSFLNMLNGIFAFSFFDKLTGDFIVARDQFGVKPLYYFKSSQEFYFSSEIKAITSFLKDKTIDQEALKNYINYLWTPGELTPFKNFRKLLQGHLAIGNIQNMEALNIERYYVIPMNNTQYSKIPETNMVDLLDKKLRKAVSRQMLSDVPIGFFLSGGLDSSLIVAIAKSLCPDQELKCYTIKSELGAIEGFEDDLGYAKKVAKYLNVSLSIVDASKDILQFFDQVIYHLDEPQADPAPINVYNICKQARADGIKVMLGGTAGDDVFSGYRRHRALNAEKVLKYIPIFLRRMIKKLIIPLNKKNAYVRRAHKFLKNVDLQKEDRMLGYFDWIDQSILNELFLQPNNYDLRCYFKKLNSLIKNQESNLNKMLFWELNSFLPDHNLNYTDKLSMATSIEVRVPFLDKELVEFSTLIPPKFKQRNNEGKYILKKVAERYLPKEVIYRSKTGFGAPVRKWITEDMEDIISDYLGRNSLEKRGIFNPEKVKKLIDENKKGETDSSYSIWALLAIESWMRQFIDSQNFTP